MITACGAYGDAKKKATSRLEQEQIKQEEEQKKLEQERQAWFAKLKEIIRDHIRNGSDVDAALTVIRVRDPLLTSMLKIVLPKSRGSLHSGWVEIKVNEYKELRDYAVQEKQKYDAEQERIAKEKEEVEQKEKQVWLKQAKDRIKKQVWLGVPTSRIFNEIYDEIFGVDGLDVISISEDELTQLIEYTKKEKLKYDEQKRIAREKRKAERREQIQKIIDGMKAQIGENIRKGMEAEEAFENVWQFIKRSRRNPTGSYNSKVEAFYILFFEEYEIRKYAQAEKQKYDAQQEAIRKQKEAEDRQKNEAWNKLLSQVRSQVQSGSTDLDWVARYVLNNSLPNDVKLSEGERQVWYKRLREVAEEEFAARGARYQQALAALQQKHMTEWRQKARVVPSQKSRQAFFIDGKGNQQFVDVVNKVLDDLKEHVPHRYIEALTYLPKAVYNTSISQQNHPRGGFVAARSDGLFALDGTDNYLGFRWLFLHEVGHDIASAQGKDKSDFEENEQVADNYACQVLEEMTLVNHERYKIEEDYGEKLPPFDEWRRNELIKVGGRPLRVNTYIQRPNAHFCEYPIEYSELPKILALPTYQLLLVSRSQSQKVAACSNLRIG